MFYCEKCATKNAWPYEFYMGQSRGPCECCNKVAACVDVPSRALPAVKRHGGFDCNNTDPYSSITKEPM